MRLAMGITILVSSFLLNAGGEAASDELELADTVNITAENSLSADTALNNSQPPDNRPMLADIKPYRVEYTASYNGVPITTARTYNGANAEYRVATEASNFLGSIKEEETIRQTGDSALQPVRYLYRRSIFGKKRTEESVFNHASQQVTNTYKEKVVTLENTDNVLGPLSYQIQLQLDLLAGQREFTYRVVSRGQVKEYQYNIVRTEKLDTPMGTIDTLVLHRIRENSERDTYLWLAEKFQYLPVKLLQKEDGETYQMLIKSYTLTKD